MEMTVYDALINEGAAKRDGLDQQATIKLVFEGGLGQREGTVAPDLSLAKFQFTPPKLPPSFRSGIQTTADQAVPTIERDGNFQPATGRHVGREGSAIVIQDSQAAFRNAQRVSGVNGYIQDEEPKSESPEIADSPYKYPPSQSRDLQSLQDTSNLLVGQESSHVVQARGQDHERISTPSTQHLSVEIRQSHPLPLTHTHSLSTRISPAPRPRLRLQDEPNQPRKNSLSVTPPLEAPRDRTLGSKSSNSKLSRPSCKTLPTPTIRSFSSKQKSDNDVYNVCESEIEDSQFGPVIPPNKKRKVAAGKHHVSPNPRPAKRADNRPSLGTDGSNRFSLSNGNLFGHSLVEANGTSVAANDAFHDNLSDLEKSNEGNGSAYSEAITGQDVIDQQLQESTDATTGAVRGIDSNEDGEVEAFIHEDTGDEADLNGQDKMSVVEDSGPKYAGGSGQDRDTEFKASKSPRLSNDSEKENMSFAAERNARISYHGQDTRKHLRSSLGHMGEIIAAIDQHENNTGTDLTQSLNSIPGRQRTALGILSDMSDESSHLEVDGAEGGPKEKSGEQVEGAADLSVDEIGGDISRPTESVLDSLPEAQHDPHADRLDTESIAIKHGFPSPQNEPSKLDNEIEKTRSKQQDNGTTKKRKYQPEQKAGQISTAGKVADMVSTDTTGDASDKAKNTAKRVKKARRPVSDQTDSLNVAEDANTKSTSISSIEKKKVQPAGEGEKQSAKDQTASSPLVDRPIKKKRKIPSQVPSQNPSHHADNGSAHLAHELKPATDIPIPAADQALKDSIAKKTDNTQRMGLGITSSPIHHKIKSVDLSLTASEPTGPSNPLPKKKKKPSTALIPGVKKPEASKTKNLDNPRAASGSIITDPSGPEESTSNPKSDERRSPHFALEKQPERVQTGSPAPIILPKGVSEESYWKMVSKNKDKTSIPVNSKKQVSRPLGSNTSEESTVGQTGQESAGIPKVKKKETAAIKAIDTSGAGAITRSSKKQTTSKAKGVADQGGRPSGESLETLKDSNSKKMKRKKTVSKENSTAQIDQRPSSGDGQTSLASPKMPKSSVRTEEAQVKPKTLPTNDGTIESKDPQHDAPLEHQVLSRLSQSDSEAESSENSSASPEAQDAQLKPKEKSAQSMDRLRNKLDTISDKTEAEPSHKTLSMTREDSGFESGAGDKSSTSLKALMTEALASAGTPPSTKSKSSGTVSHSRPVSSSSTRNHANTTTKKAPTSKKASESGTIIQPLKKSNPSLTTKPGNEATNNTQLPKENILASMRRDREIQKAANETARKAEAEKQRARLANARRSSASSSSGSDSSDESESDSDAANLPEKSAAVASNSGKLSHAHPTLENGVSSLNRPFKVPTSISTKPARKDTSSDSESDDSDDSEIVKRDKTPPPKKSVPKGLSGSIKRAMSGVRK